MLRKETIAKRFNFNPSLGRAPQEVGSGSPRLFLALAGAAEHAPMNIELHPALDQAQERRTRANLDVVRMGTEAEDRQIFAGGCELQRLHDPDSLWWECALGDRHGVSPRSTISSSTCRSLSVSIARQNPSYLYAIRRPSPIRRLNGSRTSSSPSRI